MLPSTETGDSNTKPSGVALTNDEGDSLTTVNSGAAVQGKVRFFDNLVGI